MIDPDAELGRPKMIGSRWQRREAQGDAWDGPVEIVGVYELSEQHGGGLELCIRTVDFTGQPVQTAEAADFAAAYLRLEDDDVSERLAARLRDLEARHG